MSAARQEGSGRGTRGGTVARWIVGGTLLALLVTWIVSLASVALWAERDTARPASVIVVLGAAQYVGHPSPVLRARLDHAIALWRRGLAPRLIFTGGTGDGDTTSEAAVSRLYAMKHGVPDSVIDIESQGRTTMESLRAVRAIMRARNLRTAILVSDPFHMARLRILASGLHIEPPYTSPTRTSPISANRSAAWRYLLGESIKVPVALVMREEE